MILYDASGQPFETSELTAPHDERPILARTDAWERITDALQLNPRNVAMLLRAAERGNVDKLMLLATRMEERLPAYQAALRDRKLDVAGSPIVVTPFQEGDTPSPRDVEIASHTRAMLHSDRFQQYLPDMLDALGKGYAVGEQIWEEADGVLGPAKWNRIRPEDIRFDPDDGVTPYLRVSSGAGSISTGVEPDPAMFENLNSRPGRYVVHCAHSRSGLPVNAGLCRSVANLYLLWTNALRRWSMFAEKFGMPFMRGIVPPGTSDKQRANVQRALDAIGQRATVVHDTDVNIDIMRPVMSGNAASDQFFLDMLNWLDTQIAIAVMGQTMTQQSGSSRAQAEVHERRLEALVRSDAFQASAAIRRDIVRPFVDVNWGVDVPAPRVAIKAEMSEDVKALAEGLAPFIDRGLPVLVTDLAERIGLSVPEGLAKGLTLAPASSGSMGGAEQAEARALSSEARASRLALVVSQVARELQDGRSLKQVRQKAMALVHSEVPGWRAVLGKAA